MLRRSQRHVRLNEGAPGQLNSVGLSPNVDNIGKIGLNVQSDGDVRLRSLHVYFVPTGELLDKATHSMVVVAVPSTFFQLELVIDPAPVGTWDIYVFPANEFGLEGLGSDPIVNVMVI